MYDCIVPADPQTSSLLRNKECPTCRKKLVSRRSLRRDSNFDALISKIYPSREEYEAHQRRVLDRLNRLHNKEALSSSIEEGLRQQARYRSERWGGGQGGGRRSSEFTFPNKHKQLQLVTINFIYRAPFKTKVVRGFTKYKCKDRKSTKNATFYSSMQNGSIYDFKTSK